MGLRGDSNVQLLSGPMEVLALRDYLQEGRSPQPMAVCWTGQRASVTPILGVRRLGTEQIYDVELDDGSVVHVSASAEFVMKSGITRPSFDLEPGDSLLPLYLGEDQLGYPTYQIPGRVTKRKLSRLVAEWKLGKELGPGTFVEHIDGNRKNYHPDNLRISVDPLRARRSFTPQVVKVYKEVQALFDECAAASPSLAKIVGKGRKKRRKGKTNHKITRVTPGPLSEVFTIMVNPECSIAVSGVFLSLPS